MKKLIIFLLFFEMAQVVKATVAGSNNGSTFTNVAITGSSASWQTPSNVVSSDNVYSTLPSNSLSASGNYTDYLQVTNFGFSIPSGSTIDGIVAEVERGDVNNAKDNRIRIVKTGTIGATDKSSNTAWSSEAYSTYGTSTELWGEAWTDADINASSFGVAFSCKKQGGGSNPVPVVDHVRITVYYTAPLPVKLIDFSGIHLAEGNLLQWSTGSETNNDYFTLEHSVNGIDFEDIYIVQGSGTTSKTTNYTHLHRQPVLGVNYYRLRQTDFDAQYTYSSIISVGITQKDTIEFIVFPNPATREGISIWLKPEEHTEVFLNDEQGRLIYYQLLNDADTEMKQLRLQDMNAGCYQLSLMGATFKTSKKVIIH